MKPTASKNNAKRSMLKKYHDEHGLSITELVAVLVIITVLVMLALPQYYVVVERSKAKEAHAMLRLIRAAQEVYFSEYRVFFYDTLAGSTSFSKLDIDDPNARPASQRDWDYYLLDPLSETPSATLYEDFVSDAIRSRGRFQGRTYRIRSSGDIDGPL